MGRCKETGKVHVTVDLKYYRPTEVVRTRTAHNAPLRATLLAGRVGKCSPQVPVAKLLQHPAAGTSQRTWHEIPHWPQKKKKVLLDLR